MGAKDIPIELDGKDTITRIYLRQRIYIFLWQIKRDFDKDNIPSRTVLANRFIDLVSIVKWLSVFYGNTNDDFYVSAKFLAKLCRDEYVSHLNRITECVNISNDVKFASGLGIFRNQRNVICHSFGVYRNVKRTQQVTYEAEAAICALYSILTKEVGKELEFDGISFGKMFIDYLRNFREVKE